MKNEKQTTGRMMRPVAYIKSDFTSKFGIPRQSGLIEDLEAQIVFAPEYRNPDALRGIEEFSHLWLIWEFSQAIRKEWSPTVRPPKLGGNIRKGVFATRSPFRPNPIGLSSVRLTKVTLDTPEGPILHVQGADLLDGTPIYDIKPYLPYADSHPEASGGFAAAHAEDHLAVQISKELLDKVPLNKQTALQQVLALDPRPGYQEDPDRIYGFPFAGMEIKFRVIDGILQVCAIEPIN